MYIPIQKGLFMNIFYYNKFVEKLGSPSKDSCLIEYIDFILSKKDVMYEGYTEKHHILPKSMFDDDSTYELLYNDHVKAHVLLVKAYPIRQFLRPLNFMLSNKDKDSIGYRKMLSEQVKIWWVEFKKSDKYLSYRKKRSEYMSNKMKNGFATYINNKKYLNDDNRKKTSEHFKKMWKDPDFREKTIAKMKEYRSSDEGKKKSSEASLFGWSLDNGDRKNHVRKIQKQYNKYTAERNKELWKDPDFREKMKKRKTGNNSEALKELWKTPEFREKMKKSRNKNKNIEVKDETN